MRSKTKTKRRQLTHAQKNSPTSSSVNSNKNSSLKAMCADKSRTNPSFVEVLSNRNQDSRLTAFQLPKIQNVTVVSNIKHLGIIHAYKPDKLRNCVVTNSKTYVNFFGRDEKSSANQIFFRSVVAHFKEWKKHLGQSLQSIFQRIKTADELTDIEFQNEVLDSLKQLKIFGKNIRNNIEQILNSGAYKLHIIRVYDQYNLLNATLHHVTILFKNLFNFSKKIAQYLMQNEKVQGKTYRQIDYELSQIKLSFLGEIQDSLNFCLLHPKNYNLLKIEAFVREKLELGIRQSLHVFKYLRPPQLYRSRKSEKSDEKKLKKEEKFEKKIQVLAKEEEIISISKQIDSKELQVDNFEKEEVFSHEEEVEKEVIKEEQKQEQIEKEQSAEEEASEKQQQVVEKQESIVEKQEQVVEKQEQIIEKQQEIVEKQKSVEEERFETEQNKDIIAEPEEKPDEQVPPVPVQEQKEEEKPEEKPDEKEQQKQEEKEEEKEQEKEEEVIVLQPEVIIQPEVLEKQSQKYEEQVKQQEEQPEEVKKEQQVEAPFQQEVVENTVEQKQEEKQVNEQEKKKEEELLKKVEQKLEIISKVQPFDSKYLERVRQFQQFKKQQIDDVFKQNHAVRTQAETSWRAFLLKFRLRYLDDIKNSAKNLEKCDIVYIMKAGTADYSTQNQKWLQVVKIYEESGKQILIDDDSDKKILDQSSKLIMKTIESISAHTLLIQEKKKEIKIAMNESSEKNVELLEKYKTMVKVVEQQKVKLDDMIEQLIKQLSKFDKVPYEKKSTQKRSYCQILDRLKKIILFSQSQEQAHQVFKVIEKENHQSTAELSKQKKLQLIFEDFDKKQKVHHQFAEKSLEKGISEHEAMQQLKNTEGIRLLLNDCFDSQFISSYKVIKQMIKINEKAESVVNKIEVNKKQLNLLDEDLLDKYRNIVKEEMKRVEGNKVKNTFTKYIIFLYEVCMIKLLNLREICNICLSEKKLNNYEEYFEVLSFFAEFYDKMATKSRRQNSLFWLLCDQLYAEVIIIFRESRVVTDFKQSIYTGLYFPALSVITSWMEIQFTVQYEEMMSKFTLGEKRKQVEAIFKNGINRLETLTERRKAYKYIDSYSSFWRDVHQTFKLLKDFTFKESYGELLPKILKYLRIKKIEHSALVADDSSLICLFNFSNIPQVVSRMLFHKLHIGLVYLKANPIVVKPFDFDDKGDLEEEYKDLEADSKPDLAKTDSKKCFSYWSVPSIESQSFLKKAITYRNNQFKSIQKNLSIQILLSIATPAGKVKTIIHIDDVLDECNKYDFLKLLNLGYERTTGEQKLLDLQDAARRNDPDLTQKALDIMNYFNFKFKKVYSKGENTVTSIKREGEDAAFIDLELTENNFKHSFKHFELRDFLEELWQRVKEAREKGSAEVNSDINDRVKTFRADVNSKLKEIYKEIEEEFKAILKIKATNSKKVKVQVKMFLEKCVNIKALLPEPPQLSSIDSVLQYIDSLAKELANIKVIKQFWVIEEAEKVLLVTDEEVKEEDYQLCDLADRSRIKIKKQGESKEKFSKLKSEAMGLNQADFQNSLETI